MSCQTGNGSSRSSPELRHLRPPRKRLFPVIVLLMLLNITRVDSSIELLKRFRRQCFEALPCIFFSNDYASFGCAQCQDLRDATMVEYVTVQELLQFTKSSQVSRVIMLPEFLFFDEAVLTALSSALNIEAVIVYEGGSPNINPEFGPNDTLQFPPVPDLSVDQKEPNIRHNYYTGLPNADKVDLTDFTTAASTVSTTRNPKGNGLKFRVFPFNIFRVSNVTASIIRKSSLRFSDVEDLGAQPGSSRNRTGTSPQYKLQSIGQMFACPEKNDSSPAVVERPEPESDSLASRLATVTSGKCLEDRTCMPIGGQSLWSAHGRLNPSNPSQPESRKILAIMAPMDSMAFFPDLALGASAEISSLAVLLAIVKAVDDYRRSQQLSEVSNWQPVYFALNAQSWGYAGSSRFLNDVQNFVCDKEKPQGKAGCAEPFAASLKFQDFKNATYSVLNLGQLISPPAESRASKTVGLDEFMYYYHCFSESSNNTCTDSEVFTALDAAFTTHNYTRLGDNNQLYFKMGRSDILPTDASQSFYRYEKEADVVTISNYNTTFSNGYYHSMFDNETLTIADGRWRVPLYEVAAVISRAVINLAYGNESAVVQPNPKLIDDVIICMTRNWTDCELAKEYVDADSVSSNANRVVAGNYAGSFFPSTRLADTHPSSSTKIELLTNFLSFHNQYNISGVEPENCTDASKCSFYDSVNEDSTNKSDIHTVFCSRRQCVLSDTYMHDAFGTGIAASGATRTDFTVNLTKDGFTADNPPEGAWAESLWDPDMGLCGFAEDTALYGGLILGAGLGVLFLSGALTWWFDRIMFKGYDADPNAHLTRTPADLSTSASP